MTRGREHDHHYFNRIHISRGLFDFDRGGARHPAGPALTESPFKVGDWVRPSPRGLKLFRGRPTKGGSDQWIGRRGQVQRIRKQRAGVVWEGRTSLDHVHCSFLEPAEEPS